MPMYQNETKGSKAKMALENIYIQSRPVNYTGNQGSHLYLVFTPVDTLSDDWRVIRCGPTTESTFGP